MRSTAAVGGRPDDVEAQFYDALRAGDLARLMACWADEDDIVCMRPGGPRLVGTARIRAGFEALFARGAPGEVRFEEVRRVDTLASSVHSGIERAAPAPASPAGAPPEAAAAAAVVVVVATNVFHKTAQGWRLVAHHASDGAAGEPAPPQAAEPGQTLH